MIRYTWPEGDQRSRLLFSNPGSTASRKQLTIRISYDEGRTWPRSRLLYAGSAAYSCLAALPGDDAGLIFERDNYGKISFARLHRGWLEQE